MGDRKFALYDNIIQINSIDPTLYDQYDIKRGLRNANGSGVIAGVTNISNVHGYLMNEGDKVPDEGKLTFRGYDLYDLLGTDLMRRWGYEEIAFLLLMGHLPTQAQLDKFIAVLDSYRELPDGFTASRIMANPSADVMNSMARSILLLYVDDMEAEDRSYEHEITTAISLMSRLPRIMVLAYYAKRSKFYNDSMIMHRFIPGQSTSETILSMLRPDRQFTPEEARMLDIMMCLHAEHGGGNNSTFTCRVLSSADTDPYSAYAAAFGALKGSKHGGANHQVLAMQQEIKENVKDWENDDEVAAYLAKIVNKEAFDHTGLIYGMGHAVYSISDPRARTLRKFVEKLAVEKGKEKEFALYKMVETLAPKVIAEERHIYKGVSANIDFYSGFVYSMLELPLELYTPLFAIGRIAGWSAHRLEELVNAGKIIRPAYKAVAKHKPYVPMNERD